MSTSDSPELAATGVLRRYSILARQNASQAGAYAQALIRAAHAGVVPASAVAGYLRDLIAASAAVAVVLADAAVAADLSRRTGTDVEPFGLALPDLYLGTIRLSVDTVLDDVDDFEDLDDNQLEQVAGRAQRLAANLALDVGQETQEQVLKDHGVEVWTRTTDAEPCSLCRALANGEVFPITKPMLKHPGCCCQKNPVLNADVNAGDVLTETPADVEHGPQRTLSTGHGLGRYEYVKYSPGLTFSRNAPRTSVGIDKYNPSLNGATAAAARANRGRIVVTPLAPVYDLNEYRRRKHGK